MPYTHLTGAMTHAVDEETGEDVLKERLAPAEADPDEAKEEQEEKEVI